MESIKTISIAILIICAQIMFGNSIFAQQFGKFENLGKQKGTTVKELKEGLWKSFYDTDTLYSIGNYSKNRKVESWTYYHSNGKISAKGNYAFNLKDSIWNFYSNKGALFASGKFEKDSLVGKWNFYYPNGQLIASIFYKKSAGKNLSKLGMPIDGRSGKVVAFFDSGDTLEIQEWKNEQLEGIHKKFEQGNKLIFEAQMKAGKLHGLKKEWTPKGSLISESKYLNDKLYCFKNFYENGNIANEDLYDTTLIENSRFKKLSSKKYTQDQSLILLEDNNYKTNRSVTKTWHFDTKKPKDEVNYLISSNGYLKRDSLTLEWAKNGQLIRSENYKNGAQEGESIQWYPNGNIKSRANYLNYDYHGTVTDWTEKGIKCSEGKYDKGLKTGFWQTWDYAGKMASEGNYQAGKKVGEWKSCNLEGAREIEFKIPRKYNYLENYNQVGELEGAFQKTDTLGNILLSGQYSEDWRIGNWNARYPHGQPKFTLQYSLDSTYKANTIPSEKMISAWNPDGKQVVVDGNGFFKSESDEVISAGNYLNGKKDGIWFEFYNKILISSCMIYKNGELIETYNPQEQESSFFSDNSNAKKAYLIEFNKEMDKINWISSSEDYSYSIIEENHVQPINKADSIELNWINFNDLGQLNLEEYSFVNKMLIYNKTKFDLNSWKQFQKNNNLKLENFNFGQLVVFKIQKKKAPDFVQDYIDPAKSFYYLIFEIITIQ